jgi:hypothetical protein
MKKIKLEDLGLKESVRIVSVGTKDKVLTRDTGDFIRFCNATVGYESRVDPVRDYYQIRSSIGVASLEFEKIWVSKLSIQTDKKAFCPMFGTMYENVARAWGHPFGLLKYSLEETQSWLYGALDVCEKNLPSTPEALFETIERAEGIEEKVDNVYAAFNSI